MAMTFYQFPLIMIKIVTVARRVAFLAAALQACTRHYPVTHCLFPLVRRRGLLSLRTFIHLLKLFDPIHVVRQSCTRKNSVI